MTYGEFRRQLGKAGLSIKEFASLIKQSPNSITNYCSAGVVPTHLAVIAALMGEMAESGIDYRKTLAKIQFDPCRTRVGSGQEQFDGIKSASRTQQI